MNSASSNHAHARTGDSSENDSHPPTTTNQPQPQQQQPQQQPEQQPRQEQQQQTQHRSHHSSHHHHHHPPRPQNPQQNNPHHPHQRSVSAVTDYSTPGGALTSSSSNGSYFPRINGATAFHRTRPSSAHGPAAISANGIDGPPASSASSATSTPEPGSPTPRPSPHRPLPQAGGGAAPSSDSSSLPGTHHPPTANGVSGSGSGSSNKNTDSGGNHTRHVRIQSHPISPIAIRTAHAGASTSTTHPPRSPMQHGPLSNRQAALVRSFLNSAQADELEPADASQLPPVAGPMATRKIWVRRSGASATMITINDEDLVDDVREMILRKYTNSLGRQFDAPDLTLRITPREQLRQTRALGPEEPICRVLDAYFPGGQTVDEALVIDIPLRRTTPRASPRAGPPHAPQLASVLYEEGPPPDGNTDYFGPGAMAHLPVPGAPVPNGVTSPHSIAVLTNGQIPQIPSPGGSRSRTYRERPERPRLGRQHTSSPTIMGMAPGPQAAALVAAANAANVAAAVNAANAVASANGPVGHGKVERARAHSNASSDHSAPGTAPNPPVPPPLPTPPAPEVAAATIQRVATPPPRVASPRPASSRPKKKKTIVENPPLSSSIVTTVPPINVLIVEDNIINLRLLEQFVKRLKVRWQTAMNGQEAVNKWRTGGFHLVLMDIQLPIMNGLDATREIRRLERANSIGVLSSALKSGTNGSGTKQEPAEEDRLENRELFMSPVIIVALTASSLQSDRHHALAAGCNDFLTKPLIFTWFQRKVMEWGCMQALIDFDGWRKWKDLSQKGEETDAAKKASAKTKAKKNRLSLNAAPGT